MERVNSSGGPRAHDRASDGGLATVVHLGEQPRSRAGLGQTLAAILAREIQELVTSLRFGAMAAAIFSLMVVAAISYALRFQQETRAYEEAATLAATSPEVPLQRFVDGLHNARKPPWKLAFLADGQQRRSPDLYRASLSIRRNPTLSMERDAPSRLDDGEPLDWLFVIRVLLSMAAFLLGYDAVCGQRQRAALRMVLSYPIRRTWLLAAKVTAVWLCLAVPFVLGALASLLILTAWGGMTFSAAELSKIGVVIFLGLWASGVFVSLAIWMSVMVRESARSLAILALIWVTAVIAVPGAGGLLAKSLRPLPTDQEMAESLREIRDRVYGAHGGPGSSRKREIAAEDDYAAERKRAEIQNERYRAQEAKRRQLTDDQLAQVDLARSLASLSPMFLVQDLATRLVGTGIDRDRDFVEQAQDFGDELAAWVLERDILDPTSPRLLRDLEPRDADGIHARFLPDFMSGQTIPSGEVPMFEFDEISILGGVRLSLLQLALFVLLTLATTASLWMSFQSYDVGAPDPGGLR